MKERSDLQIELSLIKAAAMSVDRIVLWFVFLLFFLFFDGAVSEFNGFFVDPLLF